ncbi:MAG: YgjP-like metallopeptidase domain-containing protein [Burkholderiales bacterium]
MCSPASCLNNGDLHFHWKCLMAPLTIIGYIVVHELLLAKLIGASSKPGAVQPTWGSRFGWFNVVSMLPIM